MRGDGYVPDHLSAHQWFGLTRTCPAELDHPLGAWVDAWPAPESVFRGVIWAGMMNRLRELRLETRERRMDDVIRAIIGATCTALDPMSPAPDSEHAAEVVTSALTQIPELAEECVLAGIAAMRVLERAPGWNRSTT